MAYFRIILTSLILLILLTVPLLVLFDRFVWCVNPIFGISQEVLNNSNDDSFEIQTLTRNDELKNSISFERRSSCNLTNRLPCHKTNKSLVISFWREQSRDKWLERNIIRVFPTDAFDHIIMVHDNSSWIAHPGHSKFIWIYVDAQLRFWYFKRFLTPTILRAYDYVWIVDDDAELTFDPIKYNCVVHALNVSFSSPSRLSGPTPHEITRVHSVGKTKIGRWTDFVEIGIVVVGSSAAWECLWRYISSYVGLGWGLDYLWCKALSAKCHKFGLGLRNCAIIDIFGVHHRSDRMSNPAVGLAELRAYDKFKSIKSNMSNLGYLADNVDVAKKCNAILT